MRIAPIVALAPFLGSKLPGGVKIGLALSLTTVFLPHVIGTSHLPPPTFDIMFIAYGLKELLMGFILSLPRQHSVLHSTIGRRAHRLSKGLVFPPGF